MAPPQLPPELVTDIIELTVELLVEEERHLEAHEPLSNQFLRSAALVDRTWNAIATPVLLNSGTVTSGSVVCFLEQVKAHGIEDTLERVRFGEASGGVTEQDAAAEDTAFDLLVGSLSGLIKIELVNSGSYFQTALPQGRAIRQVHLTNVEVLEGGFGRKFGHTPPSRIIITNTHPLWPRETLDITDSTFTLVQLFCEVENFTITSNQVSISLYITILGLISRLAQASRLRSCHFECTGPEAYRGLHGQCGIPSGNQYLSAFSHLEHLTTHLLAAHFLLTPGSHPNLKSLAILPSPPDIPAHMVTLNLSAQVKLLELVQAAPTLENLKVPARWASVALEEACEARGVGLSS